MPPKVTKEDSMKQKTLMGYFGKPSQPTGPSKAVERQPQTSKSAEPIKTVPSSSSSSPASHPALSSPHIGSDSSEPIDVDASSDEEGTERIKSIHGKRKAIHDSDQDTNNTSKDERTGETSPPIKVAPTRAKKPRVSILSSSEEEDDADIKSVKSASRPSKFKKGSPPKRRSALDMSTDDDDDDDAPAPSDSSVVSRSLKSRSSVYSSDDDAFLASDGSDDQMAASKSIQKAKSKAKRPSIVDSSQPRQSSNSFLTAAEQRANDRKEDKRSEETPYAFLQLDVIKDKDGVRPGESGYDPRTLFIPKNAWASFTPFERQFWEIKQNHYDTVLFFQKGKFLELYEDDARIGHTEFDLKLTNRVKMSMVGVPESSFNFWAAKFLGKGYKVGRVDQAETALGAEMRQKAAGEKSKEKIVRRELNKVFTNGTLVDPDLLNDDEAGHCISIRETVRGDGSSFGICALDCSTSQFSLSAFQDDVCRSRLETLIRQLRPKELIFVKGGLSTSTTRLLKTILSSGCLWTSLRASETYDYERSVREIQQLYMPDGDSLMEDTFDSNVPEEIRQLSSSQIAIEALGAMIYYLRQLNIDAEIFSMRNYSVHDPLKKGEHLVIDGTSLAHLEVLLNNEGSNEGSLLQLLSRCSTPFGKRLFRSWLCMPLRDVNQINARLDAVEDLIQRSSFETAFTALAKNLPDLERIVSRVHAGHCKNKDFMVLLGAFKRIHVTTKELIDETENFKSSTIRDKLSSAPAFRHLIKEIESSFEKPEKETDDLIPVEGKDDDYDEIMAEIRKLEKALDKSLTQLTKDVGADLEYWHSALGTKDIYLVQVKTKDKVSIPKAWTKNGGTKAVSRYIVPSLQPLVQQLKEARENRNTSIKSFKRRVLKNFDDHRETWLKVIRVLSEVDCLTSLARASSALGEPLRHPSLSMLQDFIPNDVKLGGDHGRVILLTGPNMGGKSTAMRMTATAVIMAQIGMLIPAASATVSPVDSIMTRMGAYDNMFSNSSTFKVELDECCKILRDATPQSLVILDGEDNNTKTRTSLTETLELGRGTSTFDGMAIAGAVLHQIATHTLPLSIFATHYGSLTDDFSYHPNIRCMHMSTCFDEENRELVFLYKLVEGVAESSFGTHVARLAGLPQSIIKRADLISNDFANSFRERLSSKKESASSRFPLTAQADFVHLVNLVQGRAAPKDAAFQNQRGLQILQRITRAYLDQAHRTP